MNTLKQMVVLFVGADPHPHENIAVDFPNRPIMTAYSGRPIIAIRSLSKPDGRMPGVLPPKLVGFIRKLADIRWQLVIVLPKAFRGLGFHLDAILPGQGYNSLLATASSTSRSNLANFPALMSSSICLSQASSSTWLTNETTSLNSSGVNLLMCSLISATVIFQPYTLAL